MPLSPNHRGRSVVCLASICAVTLILATTSALALPSGNTIIVNSTLDVTNSTDGLCTLREDNVIGVPRNLGLTVMVHGPISNQAFISVAGP